MNQSWADLEGVNIEGKKVQLVQEDFLVVEADPRSVRLLSNPPLNVPTMPE